MAAGGCGKKKKEKGSEGFGSEKKATIERV